MARAHQPGGRGVLPTRWSVLKEGLQRTAVPHSPGLPAGGIEGPAQVAAGSLGVPAGGGSVQRRVPAGRGRLEAPANRWPLLGHTLPARPNPLRRRAPPFVELRAGSSGPKTVLTLRLR